MTDDLLLPERARLFHIGPPKTASTALQQRAAAHRVELLDHGVRYPGRGLTQRGEVAAFLGRPIGWVGQGRSGSRLVPRGSWDAMLREIEADRSRRILFGHEYAAGADQESARRFVQSIGPSAHIVITLRDYGSMLPSIWQQLNKAGNTGRFDDWVKRVIQRPRSEQMWERFFVRHDQGELVQRWAEAAGAEHVTVVVLDRTDHDFVYTAFERMLGLPVGLLNTGSERIPSNRGMSAPEIEMMRRFNAVIAGRDVGWSDYERLVGAGAALRMLESRTPSADEPKLQLPDWSLEVVDEDSARHVDQIAASGVRVVGDLRSLGRAATARSGDAGDHSTAEHVPIEAAAQALAGMLSAAVGQGWDFDPARSAATTAQIAATLPARELLRELVIRFRRRASARLPW